jgi:hypothetical protein
MLSRAGNVDAVSHCRRVDAQTATGFRVAALLTFDRGCGSMLHASAQRGCAGETAADKLPPRIPKEPAMRIGEDQEEFEILPAEEEQPVVLPEREPQRQPEDASA